MDNDTRLAQQLAAILPALNEKPRRLRLAREARALGRGGLSRVARASGLSRPTIPRGLDALEHPPTARIRQAGGGRKQSREHDPTRVRDLEALVDPDTRGDPRSPLRGTCKSTRQLAHVLHPQGHTVSERVGRALLHEAGYRLQAPAQTVEGRNHPDREAQLPDLNTQINTCLAQGLPVVSVDAHKQALVGAFKNGGREWPPHGHPEEVKVHDFPDPKLGQALPSGV